MKVIIAGSRDFTDYEKLSKTCDNLLSTYCNIEIVSGTARGADKLGERYARENSFRLKRFPANWKVDGRAAGYIRNKEMAEYADILIAFWDGKSRGTKHMIDLALKNRLKVKVIVS